MVSYSVIGQNLRKIRKKAQLSQGEMAERIGISTIHYGRMERGERAISLETLARIADCMDVSMSALLNGCLPEEELRILPEQTAFASRVGMISEGCSEETKNLMLSICRDIANAEKRGKR